VTVRRRHVAREDDGNPLHDASWLYSYADLMTQLLIFSLLMISVLGLKEMKKQSDRPKRNDTAAMIEQYVKDTGLSEEMAVDQSADRLVIRMTSAILFSEGQAVLTDRARDVLAGIAPLLSKAEAPLRVEGHTDDVPIHSTQFPSNWELSSARAISVAKYLEDRGISRVRLSVAGYGEFHPIVPNDAAERRAMNRRVEIVVLGG
jgi:chemotaxis protein MotB